VKECPSAEYEYIQIQNLVLCLLEKVETATHIRYSSGEYLKTMKRFDQGDEDSVIKISGVKIISTFCVFFSVNEIGDIFAE
jgi:hypothetical protein